MTEALTRGVHHIGLAVPDLDAAVDFFCHTLGWEIVGGDEQYPATFVSDGSVMLTLWRVADPASAAPFDRRGNVGLHHLALAVSNEAALLSTYETVRRHPGVAIEFAPGPINANTEKKHFLCTMPGGLRLEFIPRA